MLTAIIVIISIVFPSIVLVLIYKEDLKKEWREFKKEEKQAIEEIEIEKNVGYLHGHKRAHDETSFKCLCEDCEKKEKIKKNL